MKACLLVTASFIISSLLPPLKLEAAKECIPKRYRITGLDLGWIQYLRACSDGKRLIATTKDGVKILHLDYDSVANSYSVRTTATPLKNEAFPGPDCDVVTSPYDGEKGQETFFYSVDDIESQGTSARPISKTSFNEYYSSVGGTSSRFRITNWNYLSTQNFTSQNGKVAESGNPYPICPNLLDVTPADRKNIDQYLDRHSIIHRAWEQAGVLIRENNYEPNLDTYWMEKLIGKDGFTEKDLELHKFHQEFIVSKKDNILNQPILSPSGQTVAGSYQGTMKIFSIKPQKGCTNNLCTNNTCSQTDDLGVRTSKLTFSYPKKPGEEPRYIGLHGIYAGESYEPGDKVTMIYDRETKVKHLIDKRTDGLNLASYPVFTPDGRVIYSDGDALVVADPHQVTDGRLYERCIRESDLQKGSPAAESSRNQTTQ